MKISGEVRIELWLNVYDLETEAVEKTENGEINIVDDDQFFMDWCDSWERGIGELISTATNEAELNEDEDEEE